MHVQSNALWLWIFVHLGNSKNFCFIQPLTSSVYKTSFSTIRLVFVILSSNGACNHPYGKYRLDSVKCINKYFIFFVENFTEFQVELNILAFYIVGMLSLYKVYKYVFFCCFQFYININCSTTIHGNAIQTVKENIYHVLNGCKLKIYFQLKYSFITLKSIWSFFSSVLHLFYILHFFFIASQELTLTPQWESARSHQEKSIFSIPFNVHVHIHTIKCVDTKKCEIKLLKR